MYNSLRNRFEFKVNEKKVIKLFKKKCTHASGESVMLSKFLILIKNKKKLILFSARIFGERESPSL